MMHLIKQYTLCLSLTLFSLSTFCNLPEKPIAVVITYFNNAPWVQKNLDSVFGQNYDNFRAIIVDDCSGDGTGKIVEQYILEHNIAHKVTFIRNTQRERKLFNIYNAYHSTNDNEIIVQVDGDDWLAHNNVFKIINNVYSTEDIWITYGQYKRSTGEINRSMPIPPNILETNSMRAFPFIYGSVRTFYSWLFKCIKLNDLLVTDVAGFRGKFYPAGNDTAMLFPMLEMAQQGHIKCMESVLYVFNTGNELSGFVKEPGLQVNCHKEVQKRKRYMPLSVPITNRVEKLTDAQADCIILSHDPMQTNALLISMMGHVTNLKNVYVLCQSNEQNYDNFKALQQKFPGVTFVDLATLETLNERATTIKSLLTALGDYVLIGNDAFVFKNAVDCIQCIKDLEQTFADGVYFDENDQELVMSFQRIKNDIYACQYCASEQKISEDITMSLHRKQDILTSLSNNSVASIKDFTTAWKKKSVANESVNLFFENPKVI